MSKNDSYDFSMFEESKVEKEKREKRKLKEDIKTTQINEELIMKSQRRHYNPLIIIGCIFLACIGVIVVSSMITGQVKLTELTSDINTVQAELDEAKSIYTQLDMQVEARLSLSDIEKYAVNTLGMTKTEISQIEYVSLANKDNVSVTSEPEADWVMAIKEMISSFVE